MKRLFLSLCLVFSMVLSLSVLWVDSNTRPMLAFEADITCGVDNIPDVFQVMAGQDHHMDALSVETYTDIATSSGVNSGKIGGEDSAFIVNSAVIIKPAFRYLDVAPVYYLML